MASNFLIGQSMDVNDEYSDDDSDRTDEEGRFTEFEIDDLAYIGNFKFHKDSAKLPDDHERLMVYISNISRGFTLLTRNAVLKQRNGLEKIKKYHAEWARFIVTNYYRRKLNRGIRKTDTMPEEEMFYGMKDSGEAAYDLDEDVFIVESGLFDTPMMHISIEFMNFFRILHLPPEYDITGDDEDEEVGEFDDETRIPRSKRERPKMTVDIFIEQMLNFQNQRVISEDGLSSTEIPNETIEKFLNEGMGYMSILFSDDVNHDGGGDLSSQFNRLGRSEQLDIVEEEEDVISENDSDGGGITFDEVVQREDELETRVKDGPTRYEIFAPIHLYIHIMATIHTEWFGFRVSPDPPPIVVNEMMPFTKDRDLYDRNISLMLKSYVEAFTLELSDMQLDAMERILYFFVSHGSIRSIYIYSQCFHLDEDEFKNKVNLFAFWPRLQKNAVNKYQKSAGEKIDKFNCLENDLPYFWTDYDAEDHVHSENFKMFIMDKIVVYQMKYTGWIPCTVVSHNSYTRHADIVKEVAQITPLFVKKHSYRWSLFYKGVEYKQPIETLLGFYIETIQKHGIPAVRTIAERPWITDCLKCIGRGIEMRDIFHDMNLTRNIISLDFRVVLIRTRDPDMETATNFRDPLTEEEMLELEARDERNATYINGIRVIGAHRKKPKGGLETIFGEVDGDDKIVIDEGEPSATKNIMLEYKE